MPEKKLTSLAVLWAPTDCLDASKTLFYNFLERTAALYILFRFPSKCWIPDLFYKQNEAKHFPDIDLVGISHNAKEVLVNDLLIGNFGKYYAIEKHCYFPFQQSN